MTVNEIAKIVGGVVQGDGNTEITGMAPAVSAGQGDLTFAIDEAQMNAAEKSDALCVITALGTDGFSKTVLRVQDVKAALTAIYNLLPKAHIHEGGSVHQTAVIDETAVMGENVSVGAHSVVGRGARIGPGSDIGAGCVIGDNAAVGTLTRLYPGVIVYDRSVIGDNVIVHAGTVIGADGFGYVPKDGEILKVPQMGRVIIEDDVEIGANSCVDRGTFTDTVIGRGSKLDNLVQVAHNVRIGRNVLIAGQTGIAGSVTVGDNTMMGGQAGISDHINVGRNVRIAAKTGVTKDAKKEGTVLFGYPARDAKEYMKQVAFGTWLYKNAGRIRGLLKRFSDNTRGEK